MFGGFLKHFFLAFFALTIFFAAPDFVFAAKINADESGGDCASFGQWIAETKTCLLTSDVDETIFIEADGLTLDGNGHTIFRPAGSWGPAGVVIIGRSGVVVKNLNIDNNSTPSSIGPGMYVRAPNTAIENVSIRRSSPGIYLGHGSNGSYLKNSDISGNYGLGVHCENSGAGLIEANFIEKGLVFGNCDDYKIFKNTITGGLRLSGYSGLLSEHNLILNNNISGGLSGTKGNGNTFNQPLPVGGNYWESFDSEAEGCLDLDKNNICDSAYISKGWIDELPWILKDGWTSDPAKEPVIIIPGILGSELGLGDDLLWANLARMLLDVNDEFLSDGLALDSQGNSINPITVGSAIEVMLNKAPIFEVDIFRDLKDFLIINGYTENKDLFFFAYDWRLNLEQTAKSLADKINQVKNQTGFEKVNILAHSMGGLLAKAYIAEFGSQVIKNLVFLGTPHLGAPKAAKALLFGERFGIVMLDSKAMRAIALNASAVHQLLPSEKYFSRLGGYLKSFESGEVFDFGQSKNFILQNGAGKEVFSQAEDFFSKNLEEAGFGEAKVFNFAGCGQSTQAAYVFEDEDVKIKEIKYASGDKTVPLFSADYVKADKKFYVKDADHSKLPSIKEVSEYILNILNMSEVFNALNIGSSSDFCGFSGKELIWHSPVEIHIYDEFGNHTGPLENNVIEYGVAGVDYEISSHNKLVFLPTGSGQTYRVVAKGLEQGSFDLFVRENKDGVVNETILFNDTPISESSELEFFVSELSEDSQIVLKTEEGEAVFFGALVGGLEAGLISISESESEEAGQAEEETQSEDLGEVAESTEEKETGAKRSGTSRALAPQVLGLTFGEPASRESLILQLIELLRKLIYLLEQLQASS